MKKLLLLVAVLGLVGAGLTGCEKKTETSSSPTPAPDMPSTNAPAATNAPAQ
jgi:hypothetical protein